MEFKLNVEIEFSDALKNFLSGIFGKVSFENMKLSEPKTEKPKVQEKLPEVKEEEETSDSDQKKVIRQQQLSEAGELGIKNPGKVGYEALQARIEKAKAKPASKVTSKEESKKDDSPKIEDVRKYIISAVEAGNLSQEEAQKIVHLIAGAGMKLKDVPDNKLGLVLQGAKELVAKNTSGADTDDDMGI